MAKHQTGPLAGKIATIHFLLHQSEDLKKLLRHSWLSNGRQESVAEHTWRMSLMAILLSPHLKVKVNLETTMQMIAIHDLGEILTGDYHAFRKRPANKYQLELTALTKMLNPLGKQTSRKLIKLWKESEAGKTPEAKFVQALDKIEVLIQHNEADISTWEEKEYDFNYYHGYDKVKHEQALHLLRDLVLEETHQKILDSLKNSR